MKVSASISTACLSAALAAAAPASACYEAYASLCADLAGDERVMLAEGPNGFLPNPAVAGPRLLAYPALAREVAAGVDAANVDARLRPVFEALRSALQRRVEALPAASRTRRGLLKRLRGMTLEIVDRARCRDTSRPFVAAYDGRSVLLCPWMSHLAAESMLSVMAHELGHAADSCWGLSGQAPPFPALKPGPPRAADCTGDDELYADQWGALLSDDFLLAQSGAGRRLVSFPTDQEDRAAALLFYMLVPSCSVAGNGRLEPYFSRRSIQLLLGCGA